jgi:hypothetical protein
MGQDLSGCRGFNGTSVKDHQVLMETSSDQWIKAVLTDLLEVLDQGINGVISSNYISTTKIGIDALISSVA